MKKVKQKKGKGLLGTLFKTAYYVGSNIIDPGNLKYGEIHAP